VNVAYFNNGSETITDSILVGMYDENNDLITSANYNYSQLAAGTSNNFNQSFTIGSTLPEGNYYFKATALNTKDQNRLNDFKRIGFYVSNVINPFAYRLREVQFDSVNHVKSVDGYSVKLVDASSYSAMFTVSSENTGYLNVEEYWSNSNQAFLMTPTSIIYTDDTTLTIKIRGGITNTGFTYAPFHLVTSKDETVSIIVTAPSGSDLDTDFEILAGQPDSAFIAEYIFDREHPDGNDHKLELSVFIPKNEFSTTRQALIKFEDISVNDYWWIKKLYITPLKGHEIEKDASLSIQNLTADGDPGNLTGDRFEISGEFSNPGEFDEITPVRLSLETDSTTLW